MLTLKEKEEEMRKSKKNKGGFTLIELLIVIGLLGALTALILPRLSADREEAMGDVCDYNQAGTVRVLKQFNQITGEYPADMHNGMTAAVGAPDAMPGLPDAQDIHMVTNIATTRLALSTNQAESLKAAGITSICSTTGLSRTTVAADVVVAQACSETGTNPWFDDSDPAVEMTFDGIDISDWATATGTPSWDTSAGPVVCLWVAPTTDWSKKGDGGNKDWSKGNVEIGLDMAGQCPIPTAGLDGEPDFAYYMAYFKVYNDGSAARMIGSTCPECGVLNP
ncbi:MAG: type II secretion system protein [Spartobacteria bacterium]|nr:type II secretion system protein [Spartobacteria bacterium]